MNDAPVIRADSVTRTLALGLRIMQAREYRYADAQREFGLMSLRTYRRMIARLRRAGMRLNSPYGVHNGDGYVQYFGYDLSDANGAANV